MRNPGLIGRAAQVACCAAVAMAGLLPAADAPPAFDVVSVKPSGVTKRIATRAGDPAPPPSRLSGFQYSPTRVSCNNSMERFLREAYRLESWQISGPE